MIAVVRPGRWAATNTHVPHIPSHTIRWGLCSVVQLRHQPSAPFSTASSSPTEAVYSEQRTTQVRLRRLITGLRREVRQEKLLRRLQVLWERRPATERAAFVQLLATEFGTSDRDARAALDHCTAALALPAGSGEREDLMLEARARMAPEYERLAEGLAERPAGLRLLLDLRSAALLLVRRPQSAGLEECALPAVRAFERHLQSQFQQWFAPGLLAMERVSWERTPPPMLERVIAAEAVHTISTWEELKQRLGTNRRLFVLTHPALPAEPLAMLEIALTPRIAPSVNALLAEDTYTPQGGSPIVFDKEESAVGGDSVVAGPPRCAIFYSISSTQSGLAGVDLGSLLIKRAARALAAEQPNLSRFVTLSPIPGFRQWLDAANDASIRSSSGAAASTGRGGPGGPPPPLALSTAEVNALLKLYPAAAAGAPALQQLLREVAWEAQDPGAAVTTAITTTTAAAAADGGGTPDEPNDPADGTGQKGATGGPYAFDRSFNDYEAAFARGGGGVAASSAALASASGSGATNRGDTVADRRQRTLLAVARPLLLRLCATYLTETRRPPPPSSLSPSSSSSSSATAAADCAESQARPQHRGAVVDPVANFHIKNGARVEGLSFGADTSAAGVGRAYGVMAHYCYELEMLDDRAARYRDEGYVSVAAGSLPPLRAS